LTRRSPKNERLPEPTFFVDQNLRGTFTVHLRLHGGLKVEELASHLPPTTPDVEWLPFVAEKGWVAITMDQFREDPEELVALMVHGVKVFVLVGKASQEQRAIMFLRKIKWVRRTIATYSEPFMARISMATGEAHITRLPDFLDKEARRRR
jgi:hypothetical protein